MIQSKVVIIAGYTLGGMTLLCLSSMAQKYFFMGVNPVDLPVKGYTIPALFGGVAGFIIGNFWVKIVILNQKLESRVETLTGFLPICASCKNIRDDKGYWNQIESYIEKHSGALFSHGICPKCLEKLYPKQYQKMKSEGKI